MQAITGIINQLQDLKAEYVSKWQDIKMQKQEVPANSLMAAWILSEQRYLEKKNREMDDAIQALQNFQFS